MRYIHFIILLLFISHSYAQNKVAQLYYDTDVYALSPQQVLQIDSTFTSFKTQDKKYTAKIIGYTDFVADSSYNIKLSYNRTSTIANYLKKHFSDVVAITEEKAYGELPKSENATIEEGIAEHRRVDIFLFEYIPKPIITNTKKHEKLKVEKQASETKKDSVIVKHHPFEQSKESLIGFPLNKLDNDVTIVIEDLEFDLNTAKIQEESYPLLDTLATQLLAHKSIKIRVEGHVCCGNARPGNLSYARNQYDLSLNRAKAVMNYLVKQGVAANRVSFKGLGFRAPKIPYEKTEEDRLTNRRVEIRVLDY